MSASDTQQGTPPSSLRVIANFFLVYLIWGSTYLAIKVGVADFPPLYLAALRFLMAGILLFGIGKLRREAALSPPDRNIAILSGSLLVCANGMVCVAETWLSSGLAAMIIGTIPAWISLIHWRFFGGGRPGLKQLAGILIAICGIAFLAGSDTQGSEAHRYLGILALLSSVILWSFGTLTQRKSGNLRNVFTFSGTQLGVGCFLLFALALAFEGPRALLQLHVGPRSLFAFFYLVIFGSVVAFSSYLWLSRNVNPTKVSTYAVVNPLVAVWLGWIFAGESLTIGTLVSSILIICGIYFVIFDRPLRKVRS
jgi:drug/metabolite transporter (DMT)-like permease